MSIILSVLLWGTVIGVVHFVVVGLLYQNPYVARLYKKHGEDPGVRKWVSTARYMILMFVGTQIEVYLISASYLYLTSLLGKTLTYSCILGLIVAAIRVYPRFWNMWIQSSYPRRLLAVEVVNGTIGSFVIVLGLHVLPT